MLMAKHTYHPFETDMELSLVIVIVQYGDMLF